MELNGISCARGSATFPYLYSVCTNCRQQTNIYCDLSRGDLHGFSCDIRAYRIEAYLILRDSLFLSLGLVRTSLPPINPLTKSMSSYLFSYFFPLALPNVLLPFSVIFSGMFLRM